MSYKEKMRLDVKWATQQRLQYIEVKAYYTGAVSRSDVAKAFALSDAAATKDLKLYNNLAPSNLLYSHSVFGFVPSRTFSPTFADLSPAAVLPLFSTDFASATRTKEMGAIYGLNTEHLPLPTRLPSTYVLAQITRAMHNRRSVRVSYRSLSDRDSQDQRILEPHALVDNGLRWHIRAYSQESYDFRDFVLSRVVDAECLDQPAESNAQYDDDWMETVTLQLGPHIDLDAAKRASLLLDYAAPDGVIAITVRRALLGYILQRLNVDSTKEHSMNPNAYQLMLLNRDEIEPFAAWAFL